MKVDPQNPLHRASFYLERVKYGDGPGELAPIDVAETRVYLARVVSDAGMFLDLDQLMEAVDFYGESAAALFHIPVLLAKSAWLDGMLHGIALARGLEADPR